MTEFSNTVLRGQCLCGAVRYEVTAMEPRTANCHCSMCRKFHGASFATYGEAKKENFKWLSGEQLLSSYVAPNGTTRQFCRVCGSSMTFSPAVKDFGFVEFSLATLDSESPVIPDAHIFVGSKANWTILNDDLPKYLEGRDSELIGLTQRSGK